MKKTAYFSTAPLPPVVLPVKAGSGLDEAAIDIPILQDPKPYIDIKRRKIGIKESAIAVGLPVLVGIAFSIAAPDVSLIVTTWFTDLL